MVLLIYYILGLASHHICVGLSYSIFDRAVNCGKTAAQLSADSLISGCYGFPGVRRPMFHMFCISSMCYLDYKPMCVWELERMDVRASLSPQALMYAKLHVWLFVLLIQRL